MKKTLFLKQTPSTNELIWTMNRESPLEEGFVVFTDFQTSGKGQSGNTWESARGKNLLFSMVLHPVQIPMDKLFLISELVSIAIKRALEVYTSGITIKWPNDIYRNDQKVAGILIENSLQGNKIKTVVIGIGLNVNQKTFESDAPNPVSLLQIIGKSMNRKHLLNSVCRNIMELYEEFDIERIQTEYSKSLYRKEGFHTFQAESKLFRAKIINVHPDGKLELETEDGERSGYYFKEVQFII